MIRTLIASTILIPILYSGPGRFGSEWGTSVIVVNSGDRTLEGHGIRFLVMCPIPEGCLATSVEPAQLGFMNGPQSLRGVLLHVPDELEDSIELQAGFGEMSRQRAFPTQLPIAREDDFRSSRIALPLVQAAGDVRTSLRIYSPDPLSDQQVRVTVRPWPFPAAAPLAETIVTLDPPKTPTEFPLVPSFAELVLQRDLGIAMPVRIELDPIPRLDGRIPRIWAFATVTDNVTQDVFVVSPQ